MSRKLPSHLSHHTVSIFSPPPESYDAEVARLLNDDNSVKYLTHHHSVHPSILSDLTSTSDIRRPELIWTVEDVKARRAVQEREHEARESWFGVATEDDAFAGVCSLKSIDWCNKSAEMGICLLADFWRRAITDQCHFIVLQHAFEGLLLHRISFTIVGENDAMKSYFRKVLDASHEGTLKESFLDNSGRYHDSELYSIIAPQWPSLKASLHHRIISAAEFPRHGHLKEHLII